MTTVATVDLDRIHEIYKKNKKEYSQYCGRFLYFLATCLFLDPDLDLEIALKLRPYGVKSCVGMLYFTTLVVLFMSTVKRDPVLYTFFPVQSQMNMWVM